ncbi:MAG TPA: hypothetical protein VH109_03280 [Steroidobacteraceae bacterium]|jgi:hypothetical protein|nr:hypothetical protein [Steroidobacteraceae bacterium]
MNNKITVTLMGLMTLAAPAARAAPEPSAPYEPLAFLVGHCWKGSFPGGAATDEHCFSWIYGGKFVRDEHVVHREGHPDEFGESIYVWDGTARELQYLYIESAGGFSRGTVALEGATLVFPATRYVEKGVEQTYRSRWQHAAPGEYDVITEFQVKGAWVPGFSLHMQQVSAARG